MVLYQDQSPVSERKNRLSDTGLLIIERHLVGCLL